MSSDTRLTNNQRRVRTNINPTTWVTLPSRHSRHPCSTRVDRASSTSRRQRISSASLSARNSSNTPDDSWTWPSSPLPPSRSSVQRRRSSVPSRPSTIRPSTDSSITPLWSDSLLPSTSGRSVGFWSPRLPSPRALMHSPMRLQITSIQSLEGKISIQILL